MPTRIARPDYAAMYGPTTRDRVRLGTSSVYLTKDNDKHCCGLCECLGKSKRNRSGCNQTENRKLGTEFHKALHQGRGDQPARSLPIFTQF